MSLLSFISDLAEAHHEQRRTGVLYAFGQAMFIVGIAGQHCPHCSRPLCGPAPAFMKHDLCKIFVEIFTRFANHEERRYKVTRQVAGGAPTNDCDADGHVVPPDDCREHFASVACWCAPLRQPHDEHLVIHYRYPQA